MTDWTAGYVADIGYTYGYYTELNPLRVRLNKQRDTHLFLGTPKQRDTHSLQETRDTHLLYVTATKGHPLTFRNAAFRRYSDAPTPSLTTKGHPLTFT
jgi:hypothetical protein